VASKAFEARCARSTLFLGQGRNLQCRPRKGLLKGFRRPFKVPLKALEGLLKGFQRPFESPLKALGRAFKGLSKAF